MLTTLAIANYRSLLDLTVPLHQLNTITGANGSGKSNLYRALRLLAETAQGGAVSSLAREGGLNSTLWAGPGSFSRAVRSGEQPVQHAVPKHPVNLKLGFAGDDFGYAIDLGLPVPGTSVFSLDPVIKRECIWSGPVLRPAAALVERRGAVVSCRRDDGKWEVIASHLPGFDSMMTHVADPRNAPEVAQLRERIRGWRFYDHFRTDSGAPARLPQVGTHTPVLGNDGADLAAAIQTIREIGDAAALDAAVDDAFPGSRIRTRGDERGRIELEMLQHGLLRPLTSAELSDGTLRYLLWIAALHTPRPPELLVLNEPETSLHPSLLPPLARLIVHAAKRSQVLVVSHATRLIAALEREGKSHSIFLEKTLGETTIAGLHPLDKPAWRWPVR